MCCGLVHRLCVAGGTLFLLSCAALCTYFLARHTRPLPAYVVRGTAANTPHAPLLWSHVSTTRHNLVLQNHTLTHAFDAPYHVVFNATRYTPGYATLHVATNTHDHYCTRQGSRMYCAFTFGPSTTESTWHVDAPDLRDVRLVFNDAPHHSTRHVLRPLKKSSL